jgi:hypothetical protein
MSELESIKFHLDSVAGCQLAMQVSVSFLLAQHRGNQEAISALRQVGESTKANLLASQASDYKIHAFEEMMETLIEALS